MSDVILRKSVQTRLAYQAFTAALVGYLHTVAQRVTREESGQDIVEYLGMIIFVAAAVAAIGVSGLGTTIGNFIKTKIDSVMNSK
ncbi:MAG: hypothetical protein JO363_01435 [Solirubrobacterales bacterium]|nr:hypothetical protein [Solirubrobacterales bacterium]